MHRPVNYVKYLNLSVFLLYSVLLIFISWHHESWFDEAQAWLLARDSSITELLFTNLRYEGSPGLWHLILMIPAKLHLPYYSIKIISVLVAIAGIFVFLRYSPFPLTLKLLIPFTFFLFYQYAVVARSYVLTPLILFLIMSIYKDKFNRLFFFFVLLVLLANISLHGAIISFALYLIFLVESYRGVNSLNREKQKQIILYIIAYLFVLVFLVCQLLPPRDGIFAQGFNYKLIDIFNIGSYVINNFLSEIPVLSVIAFFLSLYWFYRNKVMFFFLVPFIFLMALFTIKYYNVWHEGMLFLVWISALWLGNEHKGENTKKRDYVQIFFNFIVFLVFIVQIIWSVNSGSYDLRYNYSPSEEIAKYLKNQNIKDPKIFITGDYLISTLPYFEENIYINLNEGNYPSYRIWKKEYNIKMKNAYENNYDFVLVSHNLPTIGHERVVEFNHQDYKFVKKITGGIYWKNRIFEKNSVSIYRRKGGE